MTHRAARLHALIITGLVFLLIGAIKLVTFKSHYFDPFNNGIKDYEVTDILYSQFSAPGARLREDRIVLVHVEQPERPEIAGLLKKINAQSPAAIGLDILFAGERDAYGDSLLSDQLARTPNVVIAGNLRPYSDSLAAIPGMVISEPQFADHARNGYTNFLAGTDRMIRMFTPSVNTREDGPLRAFAVELAALYDSSRVEQLLRRRPRAERIDYRGNYNYFLRMSSEQVLAAEPEALAVFRDRIVLIGFVDSRRENAPLEDRYFTPLNPVYTGRSLPDMYGMVIHANILSMILDGDYIWEVPWWLAGILVLLFVYGNVRLIHYIYRALPDTFHGVTRILQLVELAIFFFLVALLFHLFRLNLDFSVGFLGLVLAYDVVMMYESLIKKRLPFLSKIDES